MRPEAAAEAGARRRGVCPRANTLTLLVGMGCNAACRHCAFRCHPARTEVMDAAFAQALIRRAASELQSLVMISLSGGEPFLHPALVRQLVAAAQAGGLHSAVVTNAYWAISRSGARRTLEPLRARGLLDITVSLDEFHAPFVPPSRVRNAVAAAHELGLRVHVNVAAGDDPDYRAARVPRLLDLPHALFEGPGAVSVAEFPPVAAGFARSARLAPLTRAQGSDRPPCLSILAAPAVDVHGELYACCGVGGADDFGPGTLFRVGSTRRHGFAALQRRMDENLLYRLIAALGPARLLELAFDHAGRRPFDPAAFAGSPCSACQALHASREARAAVRRLLLELARAPAGSRCFPVPRHAGGAVRV